MSDFLELFHTGNFYDNSAQINRLHQYRYSVFSNTAHTGISTFLSMVEYFLDKKYDTKDIFGTLEISQSATFHECCNQFTVLKLDFSDFDCRTYDDACQYIMRKMASLYKEHADWYLLKEPQQYYWQTARFLDLLEMKSSENTLQNSLKDILLQAAYGELHREKEHIALLIDNMVRLESISRQYHYDENMRTFLKKFIVEDVYKHCDFFLQAGSEPQIENQRGWDWYDQQYVSYSYFSLHSEDIHLARNRELIVPEDRQFPVKEQPPRKDTTDWNSLLTQQRRIVQESIEMQKQKEAAKKERERMKYREELTSGFPLLSPNLGIRGFNTDTTTRPYKSLTHVVKELYGLQDHSTEGLYRAFQQLDLDNRTDIIDDAEEHFNLYFKKTALEKGFPKHTNTEYYWNSFLFSRNDQCHPVNCNAVKVYITFKTTAILSYFNEIVLYLFQTVKYSFAIKVSKFNRADQICVWIQPKDLPCLAQFCKQYADILRKEMAFVAYKDGLGISKDFGIDVSHNHMQSELLHAYFSLISDQSEIDLKSMYDLYVQRWNGQLEEEHPFQRIFKQTSVMSFLVIMDTLDILLGRNTLCEKSLLLMDDPKMWDYFDRSRCWGDLSRFWQSQECIQ